MRQPHGDAENEINTLENGLKKTHVNITVPLIIFSLGFWEADKGMLKLFIL